MQHLLLLIGLALAPSIYLGIIIYGKNRIHPEPKKILLILFILGGASFVPAFYIEGFEMDHIKVPESSLINYLLTNFMIVAFTEEALKFICLRFYAYKQKDFIEPFDGIVCTVFVALGFATIENLNYVFSGSINVGLLRMFTSVPLHYSCGVIMGYFVGKAKFKPHNKTLYLLSGLGLAVLLHGAYDFLIDYQCGPNFCIGIDAPGGLPTIPIVSIGVLLLGLFISKKAIDELESESVFLFIRKNING